jgi:alpha-galactosidase
MTATRGHLESGAGESAPGSLTSLRSDGVGVVLDSRDGGLPVVVHWGADLGDPPEEILEDLALGARGPVTDSSIDVPDRPTVIPTPAEGWIGAPGVIGSRGGRDFSPLFRLVGETAIDGVAAGRRYTARDDVARLELCLDAELGRSGLLGLRATLRNVDPEAPYDLERLALALPVPAEAEEVFDLTGRHARERQPQRRPFTVGTHLRESRQGRPGLDSPFLLAAGRAGFDFTQGEVWGLHVAWSGNQFVYAERTYNGARYLAGGELLLPGEIRLAPGESYTTPWILCCHGHGLNRVAERFHRHLRARPNAPQRARPVLLNTWEAVYFRHDLERLSALAEAGARVGVERFVLDDGWFRGRRDDTAGLGDWFVDERVWPDGLQPLIDKVHGLGMEFGLWVEPEMVNLDSDLARAHPDWIFRAGGRVGIPSRQQYVLDLGRADAYAYISERLHALLDTYAIAYLKWDHNRMVLEAGHGAEGRPGVHAHTAAVYRLLDELRARHPGLEIESCAGGGGRIDLGILERTDRVWASDTIDALERQQIQRYTQLLLPPEVIGTHVGSPVAHTTHRTHSLTFRAITALWGHMGIEWDLTRASEAELDALAGWVALHKEMRPLLHSGRVVVADHPDPAIWISGVVAQDASEAVFGVVTVDRSITWPPGRIRLPGLDPERTYRVEPIAFDEERHDTASTPPWWRSGVRLTGRALAEAGVQLPMMLPEEAALLRATASDRRPPGPAARAAY